MNSQPWTIHAEFIVILITLVGGFYTLDGKIERQIATQCARTDKLYEMFIDVQNQIKDIHGRVSVTEERTKSL